MILRADAYSKPGGDVGQARAYGALLEEAGNRVQYALGPHRDLVGADVAMIFNIDRLVDWVRVGERLIGRVPVVGVPIHHPTCWVERFESTFRRGPLATLDRVVGPRRRERARSIVRDRLSPRTVGWHLQRGDDLIGMAGDILRSCAGIVVLANGERDAIATDFSVHHPNTHLVRNGVSADYLRQSRIGARDIDVLVAGRVEERKNVVAIAEALAGSALRVVFAGGENNVNRRYIRRFHRAVESADNLRYAGPLESAALRDLQLRARVLLSLGFFEVVSLSELEGVAAGAFVVGTKRGFAHEYGLPRHLSLDPETSPDQLLAAVRDASVHTVPTEDDRRAIADELQWRAQAPALAAAVTVE